MFKNIIEKRKLRKLFNKYLSNETINEIVNNPDILRKGTIETECMYAIFDVMQDLEFENTVTELCDFANKNNLIISGILGSLLCAYEIPDKNNIKRNIGMIIKDYIIENNKIKFRAICGFASAKLGNFGSEKELFYQPLIFKFFDKIKIIDQLQYGEVKILS